MMPESDEDMLDDSWDEEFVDEPDFLGSDASMMSSEWFRGLLSCQGVEEVVEFRERRYGATAPDPKNLLHLKAVLDLLYRIAIDGTPAEWDRVRLAHSALDPHGLDRIDGLVEARNDGTVEDATDEGPLRSDERKEWAAPSPADARPWTGSTNQAPPTGGADSTAFMRPVRLDGGEAPPLPFQGDAPAPSAMNEEEHDALQDSVGDTGFVPALNIKATASPYKVPTTAVMSPQRYAELTVRTEGKPDDTRAAVHQEFQITDEKHRRRIDDKMGRYLQQDGQARIYYAQWMAHYRKGS